MEKRNWQPVPNCWTSHAMDGKYVTDFTFPDPVPPPFTTIAWRMALLGGPNLGSRASMFLGDGSLTIENLQWPGNGAAEGLRFLEDGYRAWVDGVRAMDLATFEAPLGPKGGEYANDTFAALMIHVNRETMHHGGEIGVLRDLYRDRFM